MPDEVRDDTQHFFYPIYHQFLDKYLTQIKGSTLKVFMAIARKVNFSNGVGSITLSDIESLSGCCHHTTVEAFSEMEELGILSRKMVSGRATIYTINQQNHPRQNLEGVYKEVIIDPPQEMGGESPQVLPPAPGKNCTLLYSNREKEREVVVESSSPSPGRPLPSYDFGTFKSFYPAHRMWKHERDARDEWNHLTDPADKVAIIEHLIAMNKSPDWTKHQGKYVPNPQKYLAERYWERPQAPACNHRAECEQIWKIFLSVTGQNGNLHSLTDSRYEILSERWDDAIAKAENHSPENAMKVVEAAVEAYCDYHKEKKLKSLMTLEKIFESTETFERWIAEACRED